MLNSFQAAEALVKDLNVASNRDPDLDPDPFRMDNLLGDFLQTSGTPDRRLKADFLSFYEDPDEWFDDDLYSDRAVELLYDDIREFAARDPKVDVHLVPIQELIPGYTE